MVGITPPEVQLVAFGLSITLFIFWGVVSYAVLAVLHTQRNLLQICCLLQWKGWL